MESPERKGPERIGEIVGRLFAARGWGRQQERLHLERAWAAAAGPDYAKTTRVIGFTRQMLEIEVNSSILVQELSQFHKKTLLKKLRSQLSSLTIKDIKFKVGSFG